LSPAKSGAGAKETKKDLRLLRASQRNSPFSERVFQRSFCGTAVNYSGPLIASTLPALEAQTVQTNKHEKQMQKLQ
jgi:hypothetical protein